MSSRWMKAGPNHVPSYQTSGIPFVTSSASPFEVAGIDGNSASAAPVHIQFPYVTKFITVTNIGGNPLRMGFTPNGLFSPGERLPNGAVKGEDLGRHYYIISTGSGVSGQSSNSTQTFEIRCKDIYFKSHTSDNSPGNDHATGFTLIAGLTTIPRSNFPLLTGSVNGTGSFDGVG